MRSSVLYHLDFAEYEVDELLAIGRLMLSKVVLLFLRSKRRRHFVTTCGCG